MYHRLQKAVGLCEAAARNIKPSPASIFGERIRVVENGTHRYMRRI